MLVLTRRPGESIVIGNGIKLTVVTVGPGRVKIGVEAPPSVRIDRAEVHERIVQENAADVFEAVSSGHITAGTSDDQPTFVVSGPDTNVLPGRENPPAAPTSPSGDEPTGIRKYRAPRKPR